MAVPLSAAISQWLLQGSILAACLQVVLGWWVPPATHKQPKPALAAQDGQEQQEGSQVKAEEEGGVSRHAQAAKAEPDEAQWAGEGMHHAAAQPQPDYPKERSYSEDEYYPQQLQAEDQDMPDEALQEEEEDVQGYDEEQEHQQQGEEGDGDEYPDYSAEGGNPYAHAAAGEEGAPPEGQDVSEELEEDNMYGGLQEQVQRGHLSIKSLLRPAVQTLQRIASVISQVP